MNFTERQKREKEYYDQYANIGFNKLEVTFDSIAGKEERPWNSYWFCYYVLRRLPASTGKRKALDLGCGGGEHSIRLAKLGYEVFGLDISEKNLELARQKAAYYKVADRTHFLSNIAEKLPFESGEFDLILGIDILHHVDIPTVIEECRRILKPEGLALFREPMEVPAWDFIRCLAIVRAFAPKDASFERHITQDERKLNGKDVEVIQKVFPNSRLHRFRMLSRFERFFPRPKRGPSYFEKLDYRLAKWIPGFHKLGGAIVFELRK